MRLLLGPLPSYWYLSFQATRSSSGEGDLAVDDISFLGCALPPVSPNPCDEELFQ